MDILKSGENGKINIRRRRDILIKQAEPGGACRILKARRIKRKIRIADKKHFINYILYYI